MLESAAETGRAHDLRFPVHGRGSAESPFALRKLERLVPLASRWVGRLTEASQELGALRSPGSVVGSETPPGEERARDVEWAPQGLPAAYGDDLRAGGEGVQPLGRCGHPGPDDRDALRVLVGLVRVNRARVVRQLGRQGEPWMPGCEEHMAEAPVAVDVEPALGGLYPTALDAAERSRPSRSDRAAPRRGEGTPRPSADSGCTPSAGVAPREPVRTASRGARPGNERG